MAEEKVAEVLQDVRAEIRQAKAKRARADEAPKEAEKRAAIEEESTGGRQPAQEPQKIVKQIEYTCPYCQASLYSNVRNGKVHVVGHCGKQFRVRNGVVVRAFSHACPACGTTVQSAKAAGRIQSKHKTPDGKTCPRPRWQSM